MNRNLWEKTVVFPLFSIVRLDRHVLTFYLVYLRFLPCVIALSSWVACFNIQVEVATVRPVRPSFLRWSGTFPQGPVKTLGIVGEILRQPAQSSSTLICFEGASPQIRCEQTNIMFFNMCVVCQENNFWNKSTELLTSALDTMKALSSKNLLTRWNSCKYVKKKKNYIRVYVVQCQDEKAKFCY